MLKKIRVEDLCLGMHIKEFCGSWMEHPFWREDFLLTDHDDLRRVLQSSVREVWIDVAKGIDAVPEVVAQSIERAEKDVGETLQGVEQTAAEARPPHQQATRSEELRRAARICAQSKQAVVSMFQEVRMGRAIDVEAAAAVAEEISSSVARNPGALISLARLKSADDYTYMHSVAVCALMTALAHQLALDATATREAAMAGLLHDLGKALTPVEILNKPGKLSDEEFAVMKQHPVDGHRLLLEKGAVGEIPLDVCLHHHEKMDGSGYPDGLAGDRITLFARMGAVCDVYDAITSNRPYKSGWDPAESIRRMAEWSRGAFRRAGLPGFREKHRHLSGRFAGAARVRAAGRGGRAGAQIAPDAAGQSVFFDQVANLHPAGNHRSCAAPRARQDRRPRGRGPMGNQGFR